MWHQMPLGRIQPVADLAIALRAQHELLRNHAVLEDLLVVVDVVDEQIQRLESAASSPCSIRAHSSAADDPRNDVEGKDLLRPLRVAVDAEGDPHAEQEALGSRLAAMQFAAARAS